MCYPCLPVFISEIKILFLQNVAYIWVLRPFICCDISQKNYNYRSIKDTTSHTVSWIVPFNLLKCSFIRNWFESKHHRKVFNINDFYILCICQLYKNEVFSRKTKFKVYNNLNGTFHTIWYLLIVPFYMRRPFFFLNFCTAIHLRVWSVGDNES